MQNAESAERQKIAKAIQALFDLNPAQPPETTHNDNVWAALALLDFMQTEAGQTLVAGVLYEQRQLFFKSSSDSAPESSFSRYMPVSINNSLRNQVITAISDVLEVPCQNQPEFEAVSTKLQSLKTVASYSNLTPVSTILSHLAVSVCLSLSCIRPFIGYSTSDFIAPTVLKTNTLLLASLAFFVLPSVSSLFNVGEMRLGIRLLTYCSASCLALVNAKFKTPEEQALNIEEYWPYLVLPAVSISIGLQQFLKSFNHRSSAEAFLNFSFQPTNLLQLPTLPEAAWSHRYAQATKRFIILLATSTVYWTSLFKMLNVQPLSKDEAMAFPLAAVTFGLGLLFSEQIVSSLLGFCFASMQLGSSAAGLRFSLLNFHQIIPFISDNALLLVGLVASVYHILRTALDKIPSNKVAGDLEDFSQNISALSCLDHVLGSICMALPYLLELGNFLDADGLPCSVSYTLPITFIVGGVFTLSLSLPLLPIGMAKPAADNLSSGAWFFGILGALKSIRTICSTSFSPIKFIPSAMLLSFSAIVNAGKGKSPGNALTVFTTIKQPEEQQNPSVPLHQ